MNWNDFSVEWLFRRLGHRYLLTIMLLTRLCGSLGGMAVIYYVELTLKLPTPLREHFRLYSVSFLLISCALTVLAALWETRTLNRVLYRLRRGELIDAGESSRAGVEAVTFVPRHHRFEAWFVPLTTLVPDMVCLRMWDHATATMLMNLTIAMFMGIGMALMATYFVLEHCMQPVIRYLLNRGISIDFTAIPAGRLHRRIGFSFALIILMTAMMIGTLARQRATDIILDPRNQAAAVQGLRSHSLAITFAAVAIGIVYASILADSVASRAGRMIDAMKRVAGGSLSERLQPTGNDEIDMLARHFNVMVGELEHNDHTIRDLNNNLQERVHQRTAQLEATIQELRDTQSQLTDVAHRAGMAEVATGVLHNVGNVLNSVNISVAILGEQVRRSKLADLQSFSSRLAQRRSQIVPFLTAENRGPKLLDFLEQACQRLGDEHEEILKEIDSLGQKVEHIKSIIHAQQAYARQVPFREQVQLLQLISDVIKLHDESFRKHEIELRMTSDELPEIQVEKAKLLQVIDNLIKNAIESIVQAHASQRVVTVDARCIDGRTLRITVGDSGGGIRDEDMERVFGYGFTTKITGNGFGLHASALAVSSAGGRIYAESDGVGRGARFTIELPICQEEEEVAISQAAEADPQQACCSC